MDDSAPESSTTPSPSAPTAPTPDLPPDPTLAALLAFRSRIQAAPSSHVRQGGELVRGTSRGWDLTSLRVRRVDHARFERLRSLLSLNGRVPPHWQAFEFWLDVLEASLPAELRAVVADAQATR